jgi:hypothetical protein
MTQKSMKALETYPKAIPMKGSITIFVLAWALGC